MKRMYVPLSLICLFFFSCCIAEKKREKSQNLGRAQQTLDSLYQNYSVANSCLLSEHYPADKGYIASNPTSESQNGVNLYSYLWPYSGIFSAVNALLEPTQDKKYKELLDNRVLIGLEEYFDITRAPHAYSTYVRTSPASERFYDDNIWLGISFTDTYQMTQDKKYLEKAQHIWKFIQSGKDNILGGGIYWCEQQKESKNTCTNASGSVLALKLFKATQDSAYFKEGKELYEWTQKNLQDSTDYLYFDNVHLDGKIIKAKYAYNSGEMMQSAAILYQLTKNPVYLKEAQNIAKECYNYFFTPFTSPNGETFRILKKGNIWFNAVMLRGFIELYHLDKNKTYIKAFNKSLSYAWENARDEKGLFHADLSGTSKDEKKWLLTQAAIIEMYGRLATIDINDPLN